MPTLLKNIYKESRSESKARAIGLAIRHINASTKRAITEAELVLAVRSGNIPSGLEHHVFAFIDETDLATLCDIVISGSLSYTMLADIAEKLLPDVHPTREWLNERRGL